MALQSPFFGKREPEQPAAGLRRTNPAPLGQGAQPGAAQTQPAGPATASGAHTAATVPAQAGVAAGSDQQPAPEGGSKLTVGPNIKLKGVEITDCDTLVVEGLVEATMDSRLMQIAQCGAFKGSAGIDIAEIHGEFDGELTVRDKLVVYATGQVSGKIRYGKLVIEEGGQLSGEVAHGAAEPAKQQQQHQRPEVRRAGLQAA